MLGDFFSLQTMENEVKHSIDKFYYTILAPKIIIPNCDFTFSLSIHNTNSELDEDVVVRISIEDEYDENGFKIHRDIKMRPYETIVDSIPVGEISRDTDCILCIKGISGITIEPSLSIQPYSNSLSKPSLLERIFGWFEVNSLQKIARNLSASDLAFKLYHPWRTHVILIQTDKWVYKPNDCIKFRVFVLDKKLKPAQFDQNELTICLTVSKPF